MHAQTFESRHCCRMLAMGRLCSIVMLVHLIKYCGAQISASSSEILEQPVLKSLLSLACCQVGSGSLRDQDNLLSCVQNSIVVSSRDTIDFGVAIVTYISSHITSYASYSALLMAAYAEQQDYAFRIYNESNTPEVSFEVGDQRWNKVIIMHHALTTWAQSAEYVVWVDADLIFLDFGMTITGIVKEWEWADMLFSRDPKIENGIMNSGCIIAKNSAWSKQFLLDWWTTFDRNDVMDQLVFDYLWYTQSNEISSHVALLAADAINTNFPAWVNQQPWNQVLHLAGGSTALRSAVFRAGVAELCRVGMLSSKQQELLPAYRLERQLGLTKERLIEMQQGRSLHDAMLTVLQTINLLDSNHKNHDIEKRKADVKHVYGLINDALRVYSEELDYHNGDFRHKFDPNGSARDREVYGKEGVLYAMDWVFQNMKVLVETTLAQSNRSCGEETTDCSLSLPSLDADRMAIIDVAQDALDVGYNLAQLTDTEEAMENILVSIDRLCGVLINTTSYSSTLQRQVLYYQFKYWEFTATSRRKFDSNSSAEADALSQAAFVFNRMRSETAFGTGNGLKDPYREGAAVLERLAVLHCEAKEYSKCAQTALQSLELVDLIWDSSRIHNCVESMSSDCRQVRYRSMTASKSRGDEQEQQEGSGASTFRVIPSAVAESVCRKLIIAAAATMDLCTADFDEEISSADDFQEAASCYFSIRQQTLGHLTRAQEIVAYYTSTAMTIDAGTHDEVFDLSGDIANKIKELLQQSSQFERLCQALEKVGMKLNDSDGGHMDTNGGVSEGRRMQSTSAISTSGLSESESRNNKVIKRKRKKT